MKNQKGVSLASLAISTALVTTLSVTAVQCVDDPEEVLAKADEAKVPNIKKMQQTNNETNDMDFTSADDNDDLPF